jgi:hypothetical protein
MKIYLAASFSRRDEIARYGLALARRGAIITARWLTEAHEWTAETTMMDRARYAHEDLVDVGEADTLICFTHSPDDPPLRNTGGRHVELGHALALGKRVVIVGPRENVFHWHPEVKQFDTFEKVVGWVEVMLGVTRGGVLPVPFSVN